jgi:6 kDa early secretory antigenic target
MLVTFAAIAEASQNVNNTSNLLNQKLDDLQRQLQPLVSDWTGTAAENYQAKQRQWNQAQQQLTQVLSAIGKVLEQAHDSYSSVEKSNAATWG